MHEVQNLSHRHEHILDLMVANPELSKTQIAEKTGFSVGWISQITSSDVFKREYARRRREYIEAIHEQTVGKLYENVQQANQRIGEYLAMPLEEQDPRLVLDMKDKALHRLGYAPSSGGGGKDKGPLGAAQTPSGSVDDDEFKRAQEAAYNQGLRADNAKVVNPEENEEIAEGEEASQGEEEESSSAFIEREDEEQGVEPANAEGRSNDGEADKPAEPFANLFPNE